MCDELERAKEGEENQKKETLRKIYDMNEQRKKELAELKQAMDDMEQNEIVARRACLAMQEKQLEDNKRLIMLLKKENKRARKENAKYSGKRDEEIGTRDVLEASNRDMSEGVDLWEDLNIKEESHNGALMSDYDQSKALNRELKAQFRGQQNQYLEQAHARLELQKTMAKIITMIDGHKKKPNHLVHAINEIVEIVETMSKREMATLEDQFDEECPQGEYTESEYERQDELL